MKVRLYTWLMRKVGVKEGLCTYPMDWKQRIIRLIFFLPERIVENLHWFKGDVLEWQQRERDFLNGKRFHSGME